MDPNPLDAMQGDIALYVRLITGMILGLTVSRILTGAAKVIQQPKRRKHSALQKMWAYVLFIIIAGFWWGEATSFSNVRWTFYLYLFQIVFCCTFMLAAALIFPDDIDDFDSYGDYFVEKRRWIFGIMITGVVMSYGNIWVKYGEETLGYYIDTWYWNLLIVLPLLLAASVKSLKVQYGVAIYMVLMRTFL